MMISINVYYNNKQAVRDTVHGVSLLQLALARG